MYTSKRYLNYIPRQRLFLFCRSEKETSKQYRYTFIKNDMYEMNHTL